MNASTTDKTITQQNRKQILADPVKQFSMQFPTQSSELPPDHAENAEEPDTLTAIKILYQHRLSLEKQQKTLQTDTGRLSRQIGEAKNKQQPVDKLITSMQAISANNKAITQQIKQINQDILSRFALKSDISDQTDKNEVNSDHDKSNYSRHYSTTSINIDDIRIDLIDATGHSDERANEWPDEWNNYVASNPAACIHHRAEWREILSQSYGHESLYLCARNTRQNIVGILPLIHMKSRLFGNKLVSLPFFQRGGAVADHPLIEHKLIQAAAAYGLKLEVDHIEYRDDIPRKHIPESPTAQTHKVNMVLSLPESHDTLWQGFTAKLRAQIRRPQREQPQVFISGRENLNDFYAVYSRNMRDLGSPVQSKQFIDNILQHFPENSWLIVIKLRQRPVAAGFLLGFGNTMEIPLASTIREVNALSMNMFLYWEVLKFAIKQNYSQFDFGRSSKNAGTYRFKQQWGAQPKQLYWHYWLGQSKAPPSLNPSNPRYAAIIYLWKRLPGTLANMLGPAIVKNIP